MSWNPLPRWPAGPARNTRRRRHGLCETPERPGARRAAGSHRRHAVDQQDDVVRRRIQPVALVVEEAHAEIGGRDDADPVGRALERVAEQDDRLLEMLDNGAPRPALILGFPVGFVGAAESKAALAEDSRGVPFVTLRGRRGGSAMAGRGFADSPGFGSHAE